MTTQQMADLIQHLRSPKIDVQTSRRLMNQAADVIERAMAVLHEGRFKAAD